MATTAPAIMDPSNDVDKLSYEIFNILEANFLFGYDAPKLLLAGSSPVKAPCLRGVYPGKVCILSLEAVDDCLPAAACLARLESSLRHRSGEPTARIADFFDAATGSGAGGILAAMLFSRGLGGRPLFSAEEALCFLAKNGGSAPPSTTRRGLFCGMFRRPGGRLFRRLFGDATLRDTVKPLLIPCFDLSTAAPFLFSRADALESAGYNFLIREVCAATCAGKSVVEIKSVDGRTSISAVGGAVAMANPTSAAITHVLHNKQEFPFAAGVRDLHVFTVAGVDAGCSVYSGGSSPSTAALLQIAGNGMADTVDQAIAMAFSQNGAQTGNYVRIQAHSFSNKTSTRDEKEMMTMVEEMLSHKNIESVLFQGKRLSKETSIEKMEQFCNELIKEHEKRKASLIPTVLIKTG